MIRNIYSIASLLKIKVGGLWIIMFSPHSQVKHSEVSHLEGDKILIGYNTKLIA